MRKFSSYGPVEKSVNYYVPRKELIKRIYSRLNGDEPEKGGHYITIWGPRQAGKTWLLREVFLQLKEDDGFEVLFISMESVKGQESGKRVLRHFCRELKNDTGRPFSVIEEWDELPQLFSQQYFDKPLILIIDEFDALKEEFINAFANQFRSMYLKRKNEADKLTGEKQFLLHSVALIGIRGVLGIEVKSGSPFNVQQGVHVPDLTFDEVVSMFNWYTKESGQKIEPGVIRNLYYECQGHPGITCWFGELLTDTYNKNKNEPITMAYWLDVYNDGTQVLQNNTILNLISKANKDPYKDVVLEVFRTDHRVKFSFDREEFNFLYLNGVLDYERYPGDAFNYARFASPFIQKRLFSYFAVNIFDYVGKVHDAEYARSSAVQNGEVVIPFIIKMYRDYLEKNKHWLFTDAPRRKDSKLYEAVYHFNFYRYLCELLEPKQIFVYPEFPAGKGKIDLLIRQKERLYGLEVKTYFDETGFWSAIDQSAQYANELDLNDIYLVFFIEGTDHSILEPLEKPNHFPEMNVYVHPFFVLV